MTTDPKGITPRGDAAVAQAIDTGQPVATTAAQAAELTQPWGVWCEPKDGTPSHWTKLDNEDRKFNTPELAAEHCREWNAYDGHDCLYTVLPYPTATPPATTGAREWKAFAMTTTKRWRVANGSTGFFAYSQEEAGELASRLNAADAMEKVLTKINEQASLFHSEILCGTHNMQDAAVFARFVEDTATAALRGAK